MSAIYSFDYSFVGFVRLLMIPTVRKMMRAHHFVFFPPASIKPPPFDGRF